MTGAFGLVRKRVTHSGVLPLARPFEELVIRFAIHAQPRRAIRMLDAFNPPLNWRGLRLGIVAPVEISLAAKSLIKEQSCTSVMSSPA